MRQIYVVFIVLNAEFYVAFTVFNCFEPFNGCILRCFYCFECLILCCFESFKCCILFFYCIQYYFLVLSRSIADFFVVFTGFKCLNLCWFLFSVLNLMYKQLNQCQGF